MQIVELEPKPNKPFVCYFPNCGADFIFSQSLYKHMSSFHGEAYSEKKINDLIEKYKKIHVLCKDCLKPFASKDSLRKHIKGKCLKEPTPMVLEILKQHFPELIPEIQQQQNQVIAEEEVKGNELEIDAGNQQMMIDANLQMPGAVEHAVEVIEEQLIEEGIHRQLQQNSVDANQMEELHLMRNTNHNWQNLTLSDFSSISQASPIIVDDFLKQINDVSTQIRKECEPIVMQALQVVQEKLKDKCYKVYYCPPTLQVQKVQINQQSQLKSKSINLEFCDQAPRISVKRLFINGSIRQESIKEPVQVNDDSQMKQAENQAFEGPLNQFDENQFQVVNRNQSVQYQDGHITESKLMDEEQSKTQQAIKITLQQILTELKQKSNLYSNILFHEQFKSIPDHPNAMQRSLRSNTQMVQCPLVKSSQVSTTHGEITFGSVKILQGFLKKLGMNKQSTFLDIGSSFGQVVFQVAMQSKVHSTGIEIVDQRINIAQQVLDKNLELFKDNNAIAQRLSKVNFIHNDIAKMKELVTLDKKPITHIYSYNTLMSRESLIATTELINKSPAVETLIWNQNVAISFETLGLKDFTYTGDKFILYLQGSHQGHSFYCYSRIRHDHSNGQHSSAVHDDQRMSQQIVEQDTALNHGVQVQMSVINATVNKTHSQFGQECSQKMPSLLQKRTQQNHPDQVSELQSLYKRQNLANYSVKAQSNMKLRGSFLTENLEQFGKKTEEVKSNALKAKKELEVMQLIMKKSKINFPTKIIEYDSDDELPFTELQIKDACIRHQVEDFVFTKLNLTSQQRFMKWDSLHQQYQSLYLEGVSLIESIAQERHQFKKDNEYYKRRVDRLKNDLHYCQKQEAQRQGFNIVDKLGSGGYGYVYSCYPVSGEQALSLKIPYKKYAIKFPGALDNQDLYQAEFNIINKIQNSIQKGKLFIIKVVTQIEYFDKRAMLMDIYSENLANLIQTQKFNLRQIQTISYCILQGIAAAHKLLVNHLDIKPANILMNENWMPVVCDWGNYNNPNFGGSFGYQAPEIFKRLPKFHLPARDFRKIDSYALGITFYQMIYKNLPFTSTQIKQIQTSGRQPPLPVIIKHAEPGNFFDLIKQLLNEDYTERITPAQALQHEFYFDLKKDASGSIDLDIINFRRNDK